MKPEVGNIVLIAGEVTEVNETDPVTYDILPVESEHKVTLTLEQITAIKCND